MADASTFLALSAGVAVQAAKIVVNSTDDAVSTFIFSFYVAIQTISNDEWVQAARNKADLQSFPRLVGSGCFCAVE